MPPPIGPAAEGITRQAFFVGVEQDLTRFYGGLLNETRRLMTDLSQQGFTGEELARRVGAGLSQLSDTEIELMGRESTSEAFNLGRNLEVQSQLQNVQVAIRTEVLDINTCQPCRRLDFSNSKKEIIVNSPEYFELMPPNFCEGRTRCRGFYLFRRAA